MSEQNPILVQYMLEVSVWHKVTWSTMVLVVLILLLGWCEMWVVAPCLPGKGRWAALAAAGRLRAGLAVGAAGYHSASWKSVCGFCSWRAELRPETRHQRCSIVVLENSEYFYLHKHVCGGTGCLKPALWRQAGDRAHWVIYTGSQYIVLVQDLPHQRRGQRTEAVAGANQAI